MSDSDSNSESGSYTDDVAPALPPSGKTGERWPFGAGRPLLPRFFYWLTPARFEEIRHQLLNRRIRPTPARGAPCKAMHGEMEIATVAPEEWDSVCRRQGSWYRASERAGQFLLVARAPLPELADCLAGAIRASDEPPPPPPDLALVDRLLALAEYGRREPPEWRRLSPREGVYWRRLLSRLSREGDIERLIDVHSANHANFIEPERWAGEGPDRAPVSIGRTADVCSACIELFGILGGQFPRRLVMPCPGFCLYAGYPPDRYLESLSGESAAKFAASLYGASSSPGESSRGAPDSGASASTE